MEAETRAVIAYIAGCLIQKITYAYVFDKFQDKLVKFKGEFDINGINVYDLDNQSDIMGMISGPEVTLYHSREKVTTKLTLNGLNFNGISADNHSFNGSIADKIVKFYDYTTGSYYYYCLIADTSNQDEE